MANNHELVKNLIQTIEGSFVGDRFKVQPYREAHKEVRNLAEKMIVAESHRHSTSLANRVKLALVGVLAAVVTATCLIVATAIVNIHNNDNHTILEKMRIERGK